jgi:protein-tyrosine phosphatase
VIDTHSHILPGVDDGAADDAAALEMARIALADGVRAICATPHMREGDYFNERIAVLEGVSRLRERLAEAGLDLEVHAGSEVHLAPRLPERVAEGRLLTYGDTGTYLLLECPYRTRPVGLEEAVFQLKLAGVTPVIAHPERIRYFQEDLSRYAEIINMGALGQMTSSSLLGVFGTPVQKLSEKMVRRRMVHVLGSDAHDLEYRPPKLAEARQRWAELDDEESARLATEELPRALVRGESIDPEPPLEEEERPRGLLARLFGRS